MSSVDSIVYDVNRVLYNWVTFKAFQETKSAIDQSLLRFYCQHTWVQYTYPVALAIHCSFCAHRLFCIFKSRDNTGEFIRYICKTIVAELYLSTGGPLIDTIWLCRKFYLNVRLGLFIHVQSEHFYRVSSCTFGGAVGCSVNLYTCKGYIIIYNI